MAQETDRHVTEPTNEVYPALHNRTSRVLVIDDDSAGASLIARGLSECGYHVDCVATGIEGLRRAKAGAVDIVVLDLHLSDDDVPGFMVLAGLRAHAASLPIIGITGWYLKDEHEREARALGINEYLLRPIDYLELARSIERLLTDGTGHFRDAGVPSGAWPRLSCDSTVVSPGFSGAEPSRSEMLSVENMFIWRRLERIANRVGRAFPNVWNDIVVEQVEDALLELLSAVKAGRWPVTGSLDGYLYLAAWRNVRDKAQAAARRRRYEARFACEQFSQSFDQPNDLEAVADGRRLLALAHSDKEREALRRWLRNEGPTRIAEALGMSSRSPVDIVSEVRRFKDRITKRGRKAMQHAGQWRQKRGSR